MKRHISIFAFLLCAFAAVGPAVGAGTWVINGGYYYIEDTFKNISNQRMSIDGNPNAYTAQNVPENTSAAVTFRAYPDKGMKIANWGMYVGNNSTAIMQSSAVTWSGLTSETYSWKTGEKTGQDQGYLAVRFDYILFDISFDLNGGTSEKPQDIKDQNIDSTIMLPTDSEVTREGYELTGWKSETDNKVFDPGSHKGEDFWDDAKGKFYTTTPLKAQWEGKTYTVTYQTENCTLTVAPSSGKFDENLHIEWDRIADSEESSTVTVYIGTYDLGNVITTSQTGGKDFDFLMNNVNQKHYYDTIHVKVVCKKNMRHDLTLKKGDGITAFCWSTNNCGFVRSETDVNITGLLKGTRWDTKVDSADVVRGYDGPGNDYGNIGDADVTRELKGIAHTYNIAYDDQGGSRIGGGSYPTSATVDSWFSVSPLTKNDSTFDGWFVFKTNGDYEGALWGTSIDGITNAVDPKVACSAGKDGKVWFMNLSFDKNGEVGLKANWAGPERTINALPDPPSAGRVDGAGVYRDNADVTLTAVVTNMGYSFCCWTNSNGVVVSEEPEYSFTVTADATYTAVFTGNVVQVFFVDLHGGVAQPSSKLVTFGKPYGELATVKYGGLLEFSGWMDDDNNDVTANTKVTSTAKIQLLRSKPPTERNPIIIFADESYANTWVTNMTTTAGDPFPKPPEFRRDGYWPNGWVPALPEKATEDFTTYAQWLSLADVLDCEGLLWFTADKDSLWFVDSTDCKLGGTSLRANGPRGEGGSGRLVTSVKEAGTMTFWWRGDTGTILNVKSEKEKFFGTFKGSDGMDWTPCTITIDAASSVIFYCPGTEFKGRCSVDYFTWTPRTEPAKYEVTFTDPSKTFTNETYLVEDGGTAVAPDWDRKTDKFESLAWSKPLSPITGIVTNEAVWTCRVEFVDREMTTTNRVVYGERDVKEPELRPYPGYTHTGWNPALPAQVESNLVLTAVWTPNDVYTITYRPGAGVSGSQMVQSEKKGIEVNLYGKDKAYVRTGYSQDGWATADGGTKVFEFGYFYRFNVSTNLYPCWTNNRYTVTFDPNGGSVDPVSKVVTFAEPYGKLPTPARSGYDFMGWFALSSPSPTEQITEETQVFLAANHTLTAQWREIVVVDEVARALDCENSGLTFTLSGGWSIFTNDFAKEGISCLSNSTVGAVLSVRATTSGTLSFWWQGKSDKYAPNMKMQLLTNDLLCCEKLFTEKVAMDKKNWVNQTARIDLPRDANEIILQFTCASGSSTKNDIAAALDSFTWTPDRKEPEYADTDTPVTGFSMVDGKLGFSFVGDGSTYHLLGTNDLVAPMPWPMVFETNKASGTILFDIPVKVDEPKMFYRIRALQ